LIRSPHVTFPPVSASHTSSVQLAHEQWVDTSTGKSPATGAAVGASRPGEGAAMGSCFGVGLGVAFAVHVSGLPATIMRRNRIGERQRYCKWRDACCAMR
jgi:hypothetical protein